MWPLGHLVVGYLSYVFVASWRDRALPADWRILTVLAIGTQLPDLIDKPLSYWGILPSGRSAGHSLVVFTAVAVGIWLVTTLVRRRWNDGPHRHDVARYGLPVAVGSGSHLVADSYRSILASEFWAVRYLGWPILPAPRYTADHHAPWDRLLEMTLTPAVQMELVLTAIAAGVFVWLRIRNRRAESAEKVSG